MKKLIITMPDRSKWSVSALVVAKNRAEYYKEKGDDYDEELEFALSDNSELTDWAQNNMNWSDIEPHAKRLQSPQCDYDDKWPNADIEVKGN